VATICTVPMWWCLLVRLTRRPMLPMSNQKASDSRLRGRSRKRTLRRNHKVRLSNKSDEGHITARPGAARPARS
jgi:hypothetical protein